MNVGGVQARFAPVGAGPTRLRAHQTDAQPVGVVVHLPVGAEKFLDGVFAKEIRRPMGAVQHLDLPLLRVVRDQAVFGGVWLGDWRRCGAAGQVWLADGQHVTLAQGSTAMAAELAQHEGGFAAQVIGHVDAVAYRNISAAAAVHLTGAQGLAGLDGDRFPEGHGHAIQLRLAGGAGKRYHGIAMKGEGGAHQGGFQPGGAVMVADNAVANTEGYIVHGAGRRNADIPVAGPPRIILHGGVGARLNDLEGQGRVGKGLQIAGGNGASDDVVVAQNLTQVIQVGGDPREAGFCQGGLHLLQGVGAIATMDDDLGQHGVVVGADHCAGIYPAIQANVVREAHFSQFAGAGLEILERIFGVDAHFHGGTLTGVVVIQRRAFAAGQLQHPLHQVHAEHGFGHAVFHLQAGVHFQEIELVAFVVVDIFHRAGGAVFDGPAQTHGAGMQLLAGGLGQVRGRGFFHHFLVAALQGTFPFAQGQHGAVAVTEDLYFHMTGAGHEAFDKDTAVREEAFSQAFYGFESGYQFAFIIAAGQTNATTASGALQHHRIADIEGGLFRFVQALQQVGAGGQGHAGFFGDGTGLMLEAELAKLFRGRADKGNAVGSAGFSKLGVFGKKAVAGDDGVGAGVFGGLQNQIRFQIAFCCGLAAQGYRFIRHADVLAVAIRL